jgi:spore coat protein X
LKRTSIQAKLFLFHINILYLKKGGGVLNFNSNALIGTETIQKILSKQISNSIIVVKDSCNVNISITDTQTAIILQSLLQVLTFILTLIGLDANSIRLITVEVLLLAKVIQSSNHKIIIENSKNVHATTTNIDTVILIQSFILILTILLII